MNRQENDRKIFEELIRLLGGKRSPAKSPDQLMVEIGKYFLGMPYAAGTLETKRAEHLVVNLREFDCVTLVEAVLALALLSKSSGRSFAAFRRLLRKIRYRGGRLQGYSSRLHYFSDWIHDNEMKGTLRDVTAEIGGRPLRKVATFMTTHPELYPPLRDPVNLRRMKSVERAISRRSQYFIPKKALRQSEDRICEGDIISIVTNAEGMDVLHVGIAARVKNQIHLLHASSREGKVVLSGQTLYRYLMQSRARSGIMVARLESRR